MDIIHLHEEGLYENDDQLSDNEYNELTDKTNKPRRNNNHYRFNIESTSKTTAGNPEEVCNRLNGFQ